MSPRGHPQVEIEHDGRTAEVDEGIAPLILALWQRGISTVMSCQENNGRVWIDFPDGASAEQFLSIAAEGDDDPNDVESIRSRVAPQWEPADWKDYRSQRCWRIDAFVHDHAYAEDVDDSSGDVLSCRYDGPPDMRVTVSIRFPLSDLDEVLHRLTLEPASP